MLIAIVELRFDWDKIIQNKYNTYEKVIFYRYVLQKLRDHNKYLHSLNLNISGIAWVSLPVWTNNFKFDI